MSAKQVFVPDIGGAQNVDVIELLVKIGDSVAVDDSLITLEGDKATMEIPSPYAGKVAQIHVKVGDKVAQGGLILTMEVEDTEEEPSEKPVEGAAKVEAPMVSEPAPNSSQVLVSTLPVEEEISSSTSDDIHAGPVVRRIAREFGVDLRQVIASGPKNRIIKEDVQAFVKSALQSGGVRDTAGLNVAAAPLIDFSQFGEIETQPLNKIKKLTGANMHRNWVTVPHVTQFIEADITQLEEFRVQQKKAAEQKGVKLTPVVFIMKAVVAALKAFPNFNASLDPKGQELILKKYFNIGVAVDTPNGLVVPVIRNVDQKGLYELADELSKISTKAREKGLGMAEMQGGCFTISSLGGIGGTAFTPIVNAPEVAILGVSKAEIKPVYDGKDFVPKLCLPLSLSYDHRVIDGADGARFAVYLAERLSDIRTLLL
ncbi:MAG: aceF [Gammaproteobacteria bacterium]|nr:aceF [Gammaproteobacteria bacterium]